MSMRTYDATSYATPDDYGSAGGQDESVSVFDRYSVFDGTFNLTRDLRVEGQVKGTINCKGTLYVAQGASVDAMIDAENITVAGDLEGEVNCHGKMQILESGKVKGKITTATLVINEGALYEGELSMATGDPPYAGSTARTPRPRPATPQVSTGTASPIANESPTTVSPGGSGGNTFIRRFGGQEQTWDRSESGTDGEDSPTT